MSAIRKSTRLLTTIQFIGGRLREEDGISMIAAVMALVVGMSLSAAAFATANMGIRFGGQDKYSKQAYQSAQSGVSDYIQRLSNDPNMWQICDRQGLVKSSTNFDTKAGFGLTAINDTLYGDAYDAAYGITRGADAGDKGGHPARRWLPWATAGSAADRATESQYTIDLLPANNYPSCGVANLTADIAAKRMVNDTTATFRIRVTGRSGPPVPNTVTNAAAIESWRAANWKKVSIVTEFRRAGFLDYTYFTNHEALDPQLNSKNRGSFLGNMINAFWGANNVDGVEDTCEDYYRKAVSGASPGRESLRSGSTRYVCPNERPLYNGEAIRGPVHTNDSFSVESVGGSGPIFGNANKGDRIEVYDNGQSGSNCSGNDSVNGGCACPFRVDTTPLSSYVRTGRSCSSSARMNTGTLLATGPDAGYIDMPTGNQDLKTWAGGIAPSGYLFSGRTKIVLSTDKITITSGGSTADYDYPVNGVIYVQNNGTGNCTSNPNGDYSVNGGMPSADCALVEVQGTYNQSLTIGSESDIVFTGNTQRASGTYALLGVVANNYVRVRHYRKNSSDLNRQELCSLRKSPRSDFWWNPLSWLLDADLQEWGGELIDYLACTGRTISNVSDAFNFMLTFGTTLIDLINGQSVSSPTCAKEGGSETGTAITTIQAAIIALNRSFTVDSAQCGAQIASTLSINGAVSQNWRGALAYNDWRQSMATTCNLSGGWGGFLASVVSFIGLCSGQNGYAAKEFDYDYLLRALSPPHFLTPQESAWRINRMRQTVPACNCGPTG